jgi:ABC-2 type transport system permease protein
MSTAAVLATVTIRALLGRRRTLLMVLLAAMPVLLGLLVRANEDELRAEVLGPTIDGLVIRVVLPLIALVFGTAALGMELEDGTGVHLLTKPIERWQIIVVKTLVAGTLTAALIVPSTVISGLLMGGFNAAAIDVTFAFALANIVGSYLYTAIFLVLSVITTRGLIIGLAYALIWEAVIAGLLPGSQIFSVREYLAGIAQTLSPAAVAESLVGAGGFVYAAVALVLALVVGSVRLSRYEVRGAE